MSRIQPFSFTAPQTQGSGNQRGASGTLAALVAQLNQRRQSSNQLALRETIAREQLRAQRGIAAGRQSVALQGQEIRAETAQRGQDIGAETALAGQEAGTEQNKLRVFSQLVASFTDLTGDPKQAVQAARTIMNQQQRGSIPQNTTGSEVTVPTNNLSAFEITRKSPGKGGATLRDLDRITLLQEGAKFSRDQASLRENQRVEDITLAAKVREDKRLEGLERERRKRITALSDADLGVIKNSESADTDILAAVQSFKTNDPERFASTDLGQTITLARRRESDRLKKQFDEGFNQSSGIKTTAFKFDLSGMTSEEIVENDRNFDTQVAELREFGGQVERTENESFLNNLRDKFANKLLIGTKFDTPEERALSLKAFNIVNHDKAALKHKLQVPDVSLVPGRELTKTGGRLSEGTLSLKPKLKVTGFHDSDNPAELEAAMQFIRNFDRQPETLSPLQPDNLEDMLLPEA